VIIERVPAIDDEGVEHLILSSEEFEELFQRLKACRKTRKAKQK
jgi:hypothetical protein